MKKLLALFCVFAMLLTVCGCSKTETIIDGSFYSEMDGESMVTGTNGGSISDKNSGKGEQDKESNKGSNTANKNEGNNGDNINTGSNSKIDDPLKVDLKGATVVVYDCRDAFPTARGSTKTANAKADMIKKLQKELNCKLVIKVTTADKLRTLAATSASAGKAIGGIVTSSLYFTGNYISSNLVADLGKISSLDLSKEYMQGADVLNATRFGNGRYAVSVNAHAATFCAFYNKRILKELGYADNYLYNLVDKGKWTFTEYRKLAKEAMKDLDGKPGHSADDQWGQVIQDASSGMAPNIVISYGTQKIKLVNGKLKLNMTDSKITKALNLAHDVIIKDGTSYYDALGDEAVNFFGTGKSLFLYAYGTKAVILTKMKDQFGILPVPKVDGAKNYASAVDGNVTCLLIPAGLSAKDQYNAGAVVQAYAYLFQEVDQVQKKEYLNRFFCDDKSGENWLLAGKYATAEPTQCYSRLSEAILSGTERVFWDYLNKDKGTSPSTAIESTKVATQKALDELNSKIKDK